MWEFDDGTDWRFVWLKFCDDKCHLNFELRTERKGSKCGFVNTKFLMMEESMLKSLKIEQ